MASTTAKGKYPEQLIAMVSAETKDRIRREAAATDRSISEVARDYLEAGINHEASLVTVNADGSLTDADGDKVEVIQGEASTTVRKTDPTFF